MHPEKIDRTRPKHDPAHFSRTADFPGSRERLGHTPQLRNQRTPSRERATEGVRRDSTTGERTQGHTSQEHQVICQPSLKSKSSCTSTTPFPRSAIAL
ncbi:MULTISPECIES: IgG-binding virulence factor TspB family protein [Rhizobium]|uniref:IgG-binding virulence factor TspB family protein n=1 Tax=Rhizobium TaxID=379 RepID=UPI000DD3E19E